MLCGLVVLSLRMILSLDAVYHRKLRTCYRTAAPDWRDDSACHSAETQLPWLEPCQIEHRRHSGRHRRPSTLLMASLSQAPVESLTMEAGVSFRLPGQASGCAAERMLGTEIKRYPVVWGIVYRCSSRKPNVGMVFSIRTPLTWWCTWRGCWRTFS